MRAETNAAGNRDCSSVQRSFGSNKKGKFVYHNVAAGSYGQTCQISLEQFRTITTQLREEKTKPHSIVLCEFVCLFPIFCNHTVIDTFLYNAKKRYKEVLRNRDFCQIKVFIQTKIIKLI